MMELLPILTPRLKAGDDLVSQLTKGKPRPGDIIAVSSKAVATVEGSAIDLRKLSVSAEAALWATKLNRDDPLEGAFRQAVINETARMNGRVLDTSVYAMLTELRPDDLTEGTILAVNAGLDRSNTLPDHAIGWPKDPVASARKLRQCLEQALQVPGSRFQKQATWNLETGTDHRNGKPHIGVLLTDSCCRPRRLGVTAMALAVSGFPPLISQIGKPDLFGKELRMTFEATADQLATAANFLMGNAAESVPAVILRGHGITLTEDEGWVPGIKPEEDLFKGLFNASLPNP